MGTRAALMVRLALEKVARERQVRTEESSKAPGNAVPKCSKNPGDLHVTSSDQSRADGNTSYTSC